MIRKQLGRSYLAHAVVGAILGPLIFLLVIVVMQVLSGVIGRLVVGLIWTLMLVVPLVVGLLLYQLRAWMTGESPTLRGVFVYGLTSATSVLWIFISFFVVTRLQILMRSQVAPGDWLVGVAGQVLPFSLVGACVGVACLAIDNKR